jgi:hypothetical protein
MEHLNSSHKMATVAANKAGQPYEKIKKDEELEGLGGWLIIVGIGIFMSPIVALAKLLPIYSKMFSDGSWKALMTQGTESYHPIWTPFLISEMALNLGFILIFLFIIYLFFSKRAIFPKWYNSVLILYPIFLLFDAIALKFTLPIIPIIDPFTLKQLAIALAEMGWIPYLLVSKRVKVTFVNKGSSLRKDISQTSKNIHDHEHFQQQEPIETIMPTLDRKETNQENVGKITNPAKKFDSWTEEFKIINEFDPVAAECHYELVRLDDQLSRQFREEIVANRNNATNIKDRLMAEYKAKNTPANSNEALAMIRRLGPNAEAEFSRVVEVMGEELDFGFITKRLEEKYGGNRNKDSS